MGDSGTITQKVLYSISVYAECFGTENEMISHLEKLICNFFIRNDVKYGYFNVNIELCEETANDEVCTYYLSTDIGVTISGSYDDRGISIRSAAMLKDELKKELQEAIYDIETLIYHEIDELYQVAA